MATELTLQGPLVETLDQCEASLAAEFKAEFGTAFDTTELSYTGRELKILCRSIVQQQNLLVEVVGVLDTDNAQGRYLDNAGVLLVEPRKGATAATISARLFGLPNLQVGDRRVRYLRDDSLWRTPQTAADGVSPLTILANGTVDVTLTATETGEISAGQDGTTEWTIVDEVTGWDAVESLADSIDGTAREEDPEYRARLKLAGKSSGKATEPGVERTLLGVEGLVSLRLLNNRELIPQFGVPGKSVEAVVEGGTDLDVGNAILESYGGSDGLVGTTTVDVLDAQGNTVTVAFTRVERIDLIINIIIDLTTPDPSAPALPDNARSTIIETTQARVNGLAEGVDVLPDDLAGLARADFVGGAIPEDGIKVLIALKGGGVPVDAPYVIGLRQRARTNALAQSAEIIGTETQTFSFVAGWNLDLSVDGGNVQTVQFFVGDFANTGAVTTLEVAKVINDNITGLTAGSELGAILLRSNTVGNASGVNVLVSTSGGLLTELGLSVGPVAGSDGDISVLISG